MKEVIMNTTLDIANLATAILYPMALVIAFLLFRKEIPSIVRGVTGRLTKVEFSGISLELAKAESFEPNWKSDGTLDLRQNAVPIKVDDSPHPDIDLMKNFLEKIQAPSCNMSVGGGGEEDNRIDLPSNDNTQEHAKWLDGELLEDILGKALTTNSIKTDNQDLQKIEFKINECLVQTNSYIAVVNENDRFHFLLKRDKLLEQILKKQPNHLKSLSWQSAKVKRNTP